MKRKPEPRGRAHIEGTSEVETSVLLQRMFEMGRLLKREMHSGSAATPNYLHLETLRYVEEAGKDAATVGKPDMQAIADYLRVAGPSATRLVATMVHDGLLARVPDPDDRRRVLLSLTPHGSRALQQAARTREAAFERVLAPLSPHDRKAFARILSIIIKRP